MRVCVGCKQQSVNQYTACPRKRAHNFWRCGVGRARLRACCNVGPGGEKMASHRLGTIPCRLQSRSRFWDCPQTRGTSLNRDGSLAFKALAKVSCDNHRPLNWNSGIPSREFDPEFPIYVHMYTYAHICTSMAPSAPPGKPRCWVSEGVWCLP
jgi:hypothetical protein